MVVFYDGDGKFYSSNSALNVDEPPSAKWDEVTSLGPGCVALGVGAQVDVLNSHGGTAVGAARVAGFRDRSSDTDPWLDQWGH